MQQLSVMEQLKLRFACGNQERMSALVKRAGYHIEKPTWADFVRKYIAK